MHVPDRLTCQEVFERLADYLDRELAAPDMERVRAHIEVCAACAAEYRFEANLLDGVRRKLRHLAVPTDLRAKIGALLAAEQANGDKKA